MSELPLVSINCITYNHQPYIRKTLDGFLMQNTDFSYEVLIHDDASTDCTQEIIREYVNRWPDIFKPILQEENQYSKGITNISGHFNFPRARGRYICMCEGDDYWTDPDKLRLQVEYMEAHPDCTLCFHSARIQIEDGSLTDARMRPYNLDKRVTPEEIIGKTSGYATASLMFPSRLVQHLPDYYVNCPVGDIPLQLMMAAAGYGYYMDRDMCVYRVGSMGSWTVQEKQGDYEKKQRVYFERMKATYMDFDRATGKRFHEVVMQAVERLYFLTMVNTRQFQEILSPKYQGFYKELNLRTRFFIRFEFFAPGLYRWLQNMLHRIKSED